jgi:hypothetical protein
LLDKCCSGGRGIRRVAGCRDHGECDPVEHRQAIARAIVAETLAGALTSGLPSVSGWIRDRPVENIAADLKALPHPVQSMLSWSRSISGRPAWSRCGQAGHLRGRRRRCRGFFGPACSSSRRFRRRAELNGGWRRREYPWEGNLGLGA